jgi:hypothetical protein
MDEWLVIPAFLEYNLSHSALVRGNQRTFQTMGLGIISSYISFHGFT